MEVIQSWQMVTFTPPRELAPDPLFRERYGPHGEFFKDRVLIPLWSPRGTLLGFDSRAIGDTKRASRFMIGDRPWAVCWIGVKSAMSKIWQGKDPWIVEGAFDVFALMHAIDAPVLGAGPARLVQGQLEFLRRFSKFVNLAFDRDATGRKGTHAALKDLARLEVSCRDVPYGKTDDDPGAIWLRGGAPGMCAAFPYNH
jgi:DNA primase